MKKSKTKPAFIIVVATFITILTSCGNITTNKSAEVKNVTWNVAAYTVIPFDSISVEFADTEAYGDVLPLRYSYTQEESEKVNELLTLNDSLLNANGYTYQWVRYGEPELMDLVIVPDTPLLEQEVEVTKVNRLHSYDDNLQIAFRFNDKKQWEHITTANIGKRIAISVNGKILNAPQVNAPITQGACSVTIPAEEVPDMLPDIDLSILDK